MLDLKKVMKLRAQVIVHSDGIRFLGVRDDVAMQTRRVRAWYRPHQIGTVPHQDRHFAPVLWFDATVPLHVLYNCHGLSYTHVVSQIPTTGNRWKEGPEVAPSISYPRVFALSVVI